MRIDRFEISIYKSNDVDFPTLSPKWGIYLGLRSGEARMLSSTSWSYMLHTMLLGGIHEEGGQGPTVAQVNLCLLLKACAKGKSGGNAPATPPGSLTRLPIGELLQALAAGRVESQYTTTHAYVPCTYPYVGTLKFGSEVHRNWIFFFFYKTGHF